MGVFDILCEVEKWSHMAAAPSVVSAQARQAFLTTAAAAVTVLGLFRHGHYCGFHHKNMFCKYGKCLAC